MIPRARRTLALLLALLLCAAAIYAWWPVPEPTIESVAASDLAPAIETTPPSAPEPVALPPLAEALAERLASDAPLADVAPLLQARANAGDADAACRLAVDLLHCRWLVFFGPDAAERLARQEKEREASGRLEDANEAASALILATELQRACGAVDETQLDRAGHYLRQAALAGHPDARLRFAAGKMFDARMGQAIITSPEFDAWRREAPRMIEQALAAGDPGAVLLMLDSHRGYGGHLGMLTPVDPLAAQTSRALARRLFGDEPALARFEIPDSADPGLSEAAEARAAELHARHFNGARHPLDAPAYAFLVPPDPDRDGWNLPVPTLPGRQACRPQDVR